MAKISPFEDMDAWQPDALPAILRIPPPKIQLLVTRK